MKEQKVIEERKDLQIGFFTGYIARREALDENEEYYCRFYYSLRNSESGEWCCGLAGSDYEHMLEQINTRIMEYYEEHPAEFQKFKDSLESSNKQENNEK